MILGGKPPGKVGRRRNWKNTYICRCSFFLKIKKLILIVRNGNSVPTVNTIEPLRLEQSRPASHSLTLLLFLHSPAPSLHHPLDALRLGSSERASVTVNVIRSYFAIYAGSYSRDILAYVFSCRLSSHFVLDSRENTKFSCVMACSIACRSSAPLVGLSHGLYCNSSTVVKLCSAD